METLGQLSAFQPGEQGNHRRVNAPDVQRFVDSLMPTQLNLETINALRKLGFTGHEICIDFFGFW